VFGDPLIYVDSGRLQAIAMNSWAIQLFTPGLWRRTVRELCERPPDDIFVFDRFVSRLRDGDGGAPMRLLADDFRPSARTRDGQWYSLRAARAGHMCGSHIPAF